MVIEINKIGELLKLAPQDDPLILLNMIYHNMVNKFSEESINNPFLNNIPLDEENFPLGFDTGDPNVNKAATILRMLYINDLRNTQTKINEMISTLQSYTANPVIDPDLGKVGK